MVRKLLSIVFLIIWAGILFSLRSMGMPNLIFVGIIVALWILFLFCREKEWFLFLKKIDFKVGDFIDRMFGKKAVYFHVWFLSFLVFLAAFLAFYPGIFGYDAPAQFAMYIGIEPFNDAQHPVLHTLFIGSVIQLGKTIFGTYQAGFAMLVVIQGLLISNCMANIFMFLKKDVPVLVILLGLVWLWVNPCIQVLNCNVTKDVLFGVFMTDFAIAVSSSLRKKKNSFWDILIISLTGTLMCLFRNGLVYVVLLFLIACLLGRAKQKAVYGALAAVILISFAFSFSVTHVFGMRKSPAKEGMSVPIQQIAYVLCRDHANPQAVRISEVERETLSELFTDIEKLFQCFEVLSADEAKTRFLNDVFDSNRFHYFAAYLNVGRKNPGKYLESLLYLIHPYFNMNLTENNKGLMTINFWNFHYSQSGIEIVSDYRYLQGYRAYLEQKATGDTPFWFEPFFTFLIMGFFIARGIAEKKKFYFLGFFLPIAYFIGILFTPVALMRYAYPLMLMTPAFGGMIFSGKKYVPEKVMEEQLFEEVKRL